MPSFFLIVPPGFEDIATREVRRWLPSLSAPEEILTSLKKEKGGLSLEAPIEVGFALNQVLKTPSRILMRLSDFGCRDFPKLFKKSRGVDWSSWIFPHAPAPVVSASSHRSRLAVKKRIEEAVEDGFLAWRKTTLPGKPPEADTRPEVFVRFVDDVCTMSLDTSGEHLHKRGYRIDTPEAPIRENFAAGLLQQLFAGQENREWTLVDPMAGSGTFLIEAAGIDSVLERGYAFQNFACVREGKIQIPKPVAPQSKVASIRKLVGIDNSDVSLRAAHSNFERTGFRIEMIEGDIFEKPNVQTEGPVAVICNPPYGERLKIEGPLVEYYSRLFTAVEATVQPERAGFVLPSKANPQRLKLPSSWRPHSVLPFTNGGLGVVFHLFERVAL